MEIKNFSREALTQISHGIKESMEDVREAGGYTNPAVRTNPKLTETSHFAEIGDGHNVFLVDFNVAVVVQDMEHTDATAKLNVASLISLGAGGESENQRATTHRISFKVPLALPVDPVTTEELKEREKSRRAAYQKSVRHFSRGL